MAFQGDDVVADVAKIKVTGPYTGRFNGTLVVKIETDQSDVESLDDVKFSVSFDGGRTFEDAYSMLPATEPVAIKETGLTIEFEANSTGVALQAGMVYKVVVQCARTPVTKNEMYKALTEAYK